MTDQPASPAPIRQDIVEALYTNVFEAMRDLAAEPLDPKDVRLTESDAFRIAERRHVSGKKGGDTGAVSDLAEQVANLGLLHPILLLAKSVRLTAGSGTVTEDQYLMVSGRKRLKAAIAAQVESVPCKILRYDQLFPENLEGLDDATKDRALAEALRNVVYSESEHTSRLDDQSVLSLLRNMRENLGSDDFEIVRSRLGLKSEASEYRNVKRLWDVACCEVALRLLKNKWVRLRVVKKDAVIRVLQQPGKCELAYQAIENYVADAKSGCEEREVGRDPIDLKAYKDPEVEGIVREVDVPRRASGSQAADALAAVCEDYRAPNFNVKANKARLNVPVVSLDFSDRRPNNMRRIVDVAYQLGKVVSDIESFLRAIQPSRFNAEISEGRWEPSNVTYGPGYLAYLRQRKLILYAHALKVNAVKKYLKPAELAERRRDEQARLILTHLVEDESSANHTIMSDEIFAAATASEAERASRSNADDGDAAAGQGSVADGPEPQQEGDQVG